jgi:glycosyltransferase involved in cell wall biosynthesis
MNQPPSVSIIVTVFNREKYLAECLASVLESTYAEFEVVVVDDGSTDNSIDIAKAYREKDSRIKFFQNERNVGDYATRMIGARLSAGRYLKYVDSDDIIYPHSLAVMVQAMEASPRAALGLSHSRPEDIQPYPWRLEPVEAWRKEFLGDGCMGSGPTAAIIRRDEFFEVGGFGDWGVLSDTELWYRLTARWPLTLLSPGLVWWRRHEGQEFTRDSAALVYLEKGFSLAAEALQWKECPLSESERGLALRRVRQRHARKLLSLGLRRRQPRAALALLWRSGLSAGELIGGFAPYK